MSVGPTERRRPTSQVVLHRIALTPADACGRRRRAPRGTCTTTTSGLELPAPLGSLAANEQAPGRTRLPTSRPVNDDATCPSFGSIRWCALSALRTPDMTAPGDLLPSLLSDSALLFFTPTRRSSGMADTTKPHSRAVHHSGAKAFSEELMNRPEVLHPPDPRPLRARTQW